MLSSNCVFKMRPNENTSFSFETHESKLQQMIENSIKNF